MDLNLLMDKNYQIQLSIVRKLMNSDAPLSQKKLIKDMDLSTFLFNLNFQELEGTLKTLDIGVSITSIPSGRDRLLQISRVSETYLQKLISYYLAHSLNYQLLIYLYDHALFNVIKASVKFNTSEAGIYRKFTEINRFLAPYDLKIKKGRIHGDEIRICYFFYHLFLSSLSLEDIQQKFSDRSIDILVDYLEMVLNYSFITINRVQLKLWIKILRKRNSIHSNIPLITPEVFQNLANDPLYAISRRAYYQYINQTALEGDESKVFYLYVFLSTMFVLPATTMKELYSSSEWSTSIREVKRLNKIIFDKVVAYFRVDLSQVPTHFVEEYKYLMTQLHSQLYFFNHYIASNYYRSFRDNASLNDIAPNSIIQLSKVVTQEIEKKLNVVLPIHVQEDIQWIYINLIKNIEQYSSDVITIGVYSVISYLKIYIMVERLQELFHYRYHLNCEPANEKSTYDLLVVDSPFLADKFKAQTVYILSDSETKVDMNKLKQVIDSIYGKKKRS